MVFFVKQKTAYEMRISDWSSDVCSSDLTTAALIPNGSIEKMVDNLYGKMFKTFMGEFGGQSDLLLSIKTGVETEQIAALDEATKGKVADMFDPHRKEREEQNTKVIKPLISEALADMEPPMRAGLRSENGRAYWRDKVVQHV